MRKGKFVQVTGLADEESWMHEMFVTIEWQDRTFGVPLSQLDGIGFDPEAQQAIADWIPPTFQA